MLDPLGQASGHARYLGQPGPLASCSIPIVETGVSDRQGPVPWFRSGPFGQHIALRLSTDPASPSAHRFARAPGSPRHLVHHPPAHPKTVTVLSTPPSTPRPAHGMLQGFSS